MKIEREIKIGLSDYKTYKKIIDFLSPPIKKYKQRNYYFDSPELELKKKRSMIRLRVAKKNGDEFVLTAKVNVSIMEGYFENKEFEKKIEKKEAKKLLAGMSLGVGLKKILPEEFAKVIPPNIILLGYIDNVRLHFKSKTLEEEIIVDKFITPDKKAHYEIEVETKKPDFVRDELEKIIKNMGGNFYIQKKTKNQTFFESISGQLRCEEK